MRITLLRLSSVAQARLRVLSNRVPVRSGQIHPVEIRPVQNRSLAVVERGAGQVEGALEQGPVRSAPVRFTPSRLAPTKLASFKFGRAEVGVGGVHPGQVGPDQLRPAEVGLREIRAPQEGARQKCCTDRAS